MSVRTVLLGEYFPQDIAQLITQAVYIKPQTRFVTWSKVAIDSDGSIWEGVTEKTMEKLSNVHRVQAFGITEKTFITIEGKLNFVRERTCSRSSISR